MLLDYGRTACPPIRVNGYPGQGAGRAPLRKGNFHVTGTPRYSEQPAPPDLADRVACMWQFRQGDADGSPVRVLPDGHVDLIWDGRELFVAGPDTGAAMAAIQAGAVLTGVRLAPGTGAAWLGVPMHELTDRRVALSALWHRRAAMWEDRLGDTNDVLATFATLCHRHAVAPDRPMREVFHLLAGQHATRVTELATVLGYSERSLRRHCLDAFGYGPKTLDRILRLQRFLALAPRQPSLTSAALAAGYADAPHLVRDAQRLAGLSPRELVAQHGR